jgi:hypothetical protein
VPEEQESVIALFAKRLNVADMLLHANWKTDDARQRTSIEGKSTHSTMSSDWCGRQQNDGFRHLATNACQRTSVQKRLIGGQGRKMPTGTCAELCRACRLQSGPKSERHHQKQTKEDKRLCSRTYPEHGVSMCAIVSVDFALLSARRKTGHASVCVLTRLHSPSCLHRACRGC